MPLALTMGEPAGVGGDLALMAWSRRGEGIPPFLIIDDPVRLAGLTRRLGLAVPVAEIASAAEAAAIFPHALPVLPQSLAKAVEPGHPDPANVAAVTASIRRAVALALAGEAAALVTNPIHKQVMHRGGFAFPGHTEFLASLLGESPPREVMMLACPGLRVVPVTIHVSLAAAVAGLRADDIVEIGMVTAKALGQDFGIGRPRLAVAALNPHAGEGGDMGREDIDIVAPAVERLRLAGIDAFGPLPADTLFHARARQTYDAALCMYHDQALIPLKTIDFDRGVNITLGLPFVRTSPDHGTAFDLAGTGGASPDSLMAALRAAADIAANRRKRR
ncbi:4-hydroxythreonine-4-phosphate dehydrogenase PdxA [Magnetospirillum sp. SS-4]|uniref:4-hydroxythreonine-4-phosphate dehydrogenase PdxA n=1 Tax=Magnetospirillum sp. SS-4 TaxID=2681465 RepID=UPI0015746C31|nr:4-hydroxythreonine-4-phosphate dehydrogenase PdxA [Magnetospirillum sp. SS-4]